MTERFTWRVAGAGQHSLASAMLLMVTLVACQQSGSAASHDSARAPVTATASVATSPESAAAQAMRAGPEEVIALYTKWDTAGKFMSRGDEPSYDRAVDAMICWSPADNCQTDSPGWDESSIIRSFTMRTVSKQDTTARIAVTYDVVGQLVGGKFKAVKASSATWTVELQKMRGNWRIVDAESQKPPSVSPSAALRIVKTASDSAALKRLAASGGS